jgi:hypothetical protein
MACVSGNGSIAADGLHRKRALTIVEQISKVAPVDG